MSDLLWEKFHKLARDVEDIKAKLKAPQPPDDPAPDTGNAEQLEDAPQPVVNFYPPPDPDA